ncbi:MAG TPA: hypothetical protein PKI19_10180 [Elusimicrobiales bacterium]|nr:hypothetical protein [Elusimicrobiales bacterium]
MEYKALIPSDRAPAPFAGALPADARHRWSVLLLWACFLAYLAYWARLHWGWLFDPLLQNDDARIWIFPFHRCTPGAPLAADPVALEKLALTPYGLRLLYQALVPWTGVYAAPKIVQGLCLAVAGWAGWALGRSRRGGLAAGVLLVFLVLNTAFIVNRMAGGLARSFAFPLLALWAAGVFSRRERLRWAAVLLAALTYPSALVLLLGCEALTALWENLRPGGKLARRALLRAVFLAGASLLLMLPYAADTKHLGRPFTMRDAVNEPAFHAKGRLPELPFPGLDDLRKKLAPYPGYALAPAGLGALAVLALLARCVLPAAAMAFLAASAGLYGLSRLLAFRLFLPERFVEYAGPMLCLMLALALLRLVAARTRGPGRYALRNFAVCVFMAGSLLLFPKNVRTENGMTIEGRTHARLYAFLRTLPADISIACHPDDGSDIPFWAGRSTLVNRENLLPFAVEFWEFQKGRARAALAALYAVRREDALAFTGKYGVTHFLLNEGRYGADFKAASSMFEPFGSYAAELTAPLKREDLVLAAVPPQAVVLREPPFLLVDVKLLREAWGQSRAGGQRQPLPRGAAGRK